MSVGANKSFLRFAITASCLAILSTTASAAPIPDSIDQKPVSLNVQQAPVTSVLRTLFKSANVNFSIDPDVRGADTITLNNVTFGAALRSILHANIPKLAYDYRDGVVHVSVAKVEAPAIPTASSTASTGPTTTNGAGGAVTSSGAHYFKLPVDHYDVAMMALLLRMSTAKTVSLVPSTGVGGMGSRMSGMAGMGTGTNGMSGTGTRGGSTGNMGSGMRGSTGVGGGNFGGRR